MGKFRVGPFRGSDAWTVRPRIWSLEGSPGGGLSGGSSQYSPHYVRLAETPPLKCEWWAEPGSLRVDRKGAEPVWVFEGTGSGVAGCPGGGQTPQWGCLLTSGSGVRDCGGGKRWVGWPAPGCAQEGPAAGITWLWIWGPLRQEKWWRVRLLLGVVWWGRRSGQRRRGNSPQPPACA